MSDRLDATTITQAQMQLSGGKRMFSDTGEGFCFTPHVWRTTVRQDGRERWYKDAVTHRDEAWSRMVQCRLSGAPIEADHWRACARFFENEFKIPRVGEQDGRHTRTA